MEEPYTEQELKRCLEILQALETNALTNLKPDSEALDILSAAKSLVHASKSQYKKQTRQRQNDLAKAAGPAITKQLNATNSPMTASITATNNSGADTHDEGRFYSRPKSCYVCKQQFSQRHHFYGQLCKSCGDFNFEKRQQSAKMFGLTAVLTGGRVKIGHDVALKLLRSGCRVLMTTRFPSDADQRFASQPDYSDWSDRLNIYALDLRNSPAIFDFAKYVRESFNKIDLLINNAAQTIARPPAFYQHLVERELNPVNKPTTIVKPSAIAPPVLPLGFQQDRNATTVAVPEIAISEQNFFPKDVLDLDQQQVDLRPRNTWDATIDEVGPQELFEVMLVNSIAPFLLMNQLIPLLDHPPEPSFIINVSAVEGQFNTLTKRPHHPHTNMAKAGLNMLTRTCAESLAQRHIYVNSVDTGWITNEFNHQRSQQMNDEGWVRPLDELDGAARILDPVFSVINGEVPLHGNFLKDYKVAPW